MAGDSTFASPPCAGRAGRPRALPGPCRLRGQTAGCRALSNGIEIEYDTFGDPSDPALLLVMGFTAQLIAWDEEFCKLLVDRASTSSASTTATAGSRTKLDGVQVDLGAVHGGAAERHEPDAGDAPCPTS